MTISAVKVVRADYENRRHGEAIVSLLSAYALDPMGGGVTLPDNVKQTLVSRLAEVPGAISLIAFHGAQKAGLLNAFPGFSTFSAAPLINIHDIVVLAEFRNLGISTAMLNVLEKIAIRRGCSKLTLEVLEGNLPAQCAYRKFGFGAYALDPDLGHALFWQKKIL